MAPKKSIGKGHTIFDGEVKNETGIWVLLAESCYEISKSLLRERSCADILETGFSTFDSPLGGYQIVPQEFLRYSEEMYACLAQHEGLRLLVGLNWTEIRRIHVRVQCRNYIEPLFYEETPVEKRHELLEMIRSKFKQTDIVGVGLEGCRMQRPKTYTPSRSEERKRALEILGNNVVVKNLWQKLQTH